MELKDFLYERKVKLLQGEKFAKGKAKLAIVFQIQVLESILAFIHSKQQESDMAKLQLSLDAQATPLDDIKPRQRDNAVAEAIIELVETIPPGGKKQINAPGISPRTVLTTVYDLKRKGILPKSILAITRNNGAEAYVGRAAEEEKPEVVKTTKAAKGK